MNNWQQDKMLTKLCTNAIETTRFNSRTFLLIVLYYIVINVSFSLIFSSSFFSFFERNFLWSWRLPFGCLVNYKLWLPFMVNSSFFLNWFIHLIENKWRTMHCLTTDRAFSSIALPMNCYFVFVTVGTCHAHDFIREVEIERTSCC